MPGATFDDEDVLAFATGPATWSTHFDGGTIDPADWPQADLVALPEPAGSLSIAAALVALLASGRCLFARSSHLRRGTDRPLRGWAKELSARIRRRRSA